MLDEAKWGLDWMHKMHPRPDELYHQVADDRDHTGWKWPNQDNSDYGWGPNSYRVVYCADGKPQGLANTRASRRHRESGRALCRAMAMGHSHLEARSAGRSVCRKCLKAAVEVYHLGKARGVSTRQLL